MRNPNIFSNKAWAQGRLLEIRSFFQTKSKIHFVALVLVLFFGSFSNLVVYAQASCNVQVAFKVTDTKGGQVNSLDNKSASLRLFATYTPKPVGPECYGVTFKHRFRILFADGTYELVGPEESFSFQTTANARRDELVPKEVTLDWQASGLKDFNTKAPVQNNGTLKVESYLATTNGVSVTKSSPVTLSVKNVTQAPGGQNPVGSGNSQNAGTGNVGSGNGGGTSAEPISFSGGLTNPIKYNSVGGFLSGIIAFLLALIGGLSVLFIVIGGVQMMGSAGNADQLTKGKKTLTWAVVGLLVALLGYAIINVVQSIV